MTTPEQNVSTGFHRRGLALSYIYRRAKGVLWESEVLDSLVTEIRSECEQLGIEPMSDATARTYAGEDPGSPD